MIGIPELGGPAPRLPAIHLEGRLPLVEAAQAVLLGLRDGQVVRPAVAVRDGAMALLLQGLAVPLPPALAGMAQAGGAWRVQLDAAGRALLWPLAAEAAAAAPLPVLPDRVQRLLAHPGGIAPLLALLAPGALDGVLAQGPPPQAAALLEGWLRGLPAAARAGAPQLRQLAAWAGWGQEAALARGLPVVPGLRSLLRSLVADWPDAPAATRTLLADALDALEARQLQAATAAGEPAPSLVLPFADAPPLQLRWQRESAPDDGAPAGRRAPAWRVDVHGDMAETGPLWLRTRIGAREVELSLWAEREAVAQRARGGAALLALGLAEAGLVLGSLQVLHGRPAWWPAQEPAPAAPGGGLVDLRA